MSFAFDTGRRGWDLDFFVHGTPQTAGSKTQVPISKGGVVVARRIVESGDKTAKAQWRSDVRDAAMDAVMMAPIGVWPTGEALEVEFAFVRKRPDGHYGSGRNSDRLKDWAVGLRPVTRPDVLKQARAAEDALTGVLWSDDSIIVSEVLEKWFPDQLGLQRRAVGAQIRVRRLNDKIVSTH